MAFQIGALESHLNSTFIGTECAMKVPSSLFMSETWKWKPELEILKFWIWEDSAPDRMPRRVLRICNLYIPRDFRMELRNTACRMHRVNLSDSKTSHQVDIVFYCNGVNRRMTKWSYQMYCSWNVSSDHFLCKIRAWGITYAQLMPKSHQKLLTQKSLPCTNLSDSPDRLRNNY